MAVHVRLGVLLGDFVADGKGVRVRVAVPVGSTRCVVVTVMVCDELALVTEGTPGVSGVAVHNSGSDRWDGVSVGTCKLATGVGGGKGLINEYGLMKMLMKMVARANPPSITIEANMSQNDSFIASHPYYCIAMRFFSV